MKNLLKITAIGMVITLFSCGKSDIIRMDSIDGLKKIKSMAIEKFGGDLEVYSINISSMEDLNSDLRTIAVNYLKDGKNYTRVYNEKTEYTEAELSDEKLRGGSYQDKRHLNNAKGKLKISDLDIDKVVLNIDKAIEILGDDVAFFHVIDLSIDVDPKTNAITNTFELHFTKKGEGTTMQGRNIVTNFYESNFEVDGDGNVVMTD